jgi:two-component system, cell cycle response regulator
MSFDDASERAKGALTSVGRSNPGAGDTRDATDCLVVVYTREPTIFGKRFSLQHSPTRVGRSADNEIVLGSDSVSRKHAHFERRGESWMVLDHGSTNGTYCNDAPVDRELALQNGDRVKIGPTVFKFLSGPDIEERYNEEIYRMTIVDGLTETYNKRYLYEALEREIFRSRQRRRDLAIIMLDIDPFERINDVYGHLAGDFVLREIARLLQPELHSDDVLARYGSEQFVIVLPERGIEAAVDLGQILRQKVAEHVFVFQGENIEVTVSAAAASWEETDRDSRSLLKRADQALNVGRREGGQRVVAAPASGGEASEIITRFGDRPLLDGPSLLQKALTRGNVGALVAFEVDDEVAIVERFGPKVYETWFRQLVREVEEGLGRDDLLATFRDHYVLCALQDGSADAVTRLATRVQETWGARPVPEAHRSVPRQARSASLTTAELGVHRERSLDVLVARLLPRAAAVAEEDLPYPLAAARALAASRTSPLERARALLDAIEIALRFVVSVALGTLRETDDPSSYDRAAEVIVNTSRRGEPWEHSALGLLPLLPTDAGELLVATARQFANAKVRGAPLGEMLEWASMLRRALAGQTGLSDEAYADEADRLSALLEAILAALGPLSKLRMVSVSEIEDLDEEEEVIRYALYLHRGPSEQFSVIRESSMHRLQKGWCYLLTPDGSSAPLLLAPVAFARTCDACGRIEVAIADELTLGPKGVNVKGRGVLSKHEGTLALPWQKRMQAFYAALLAVSARDADD